VIRGKLKRGLITGIILAICVPLWATPSPKEKALTNLILNSLTQTHYAPLKIDNSYSERVYDLYLKRLDPGKTFLTQIDINALNNYRYTIDNQLLQSQDAFFEDATARYQEGIQYVQSIYKDILSDPFPITQNVSIQLKAEKRAYPKDKDAQKQLWRKLISYQVMISYFNLLKEDDKTPSNNTESLAFKWDAKLEKKARKKIQKSLGRRLKRLQKEKRSYRHERYLNALAQVYDPHTSYFPPAEKEDFDIGMTGTLEGIGAVLREDDGKIKVVRIIPGSAAWRQGELKAEDIILKVAQKKGDPVDIVDVPVREAVKHIRGKKGTLVKLTVKKPDRQIKIIPIIRDVVVIEDTYAKTAIYQSKATKADIGYIYLPSFYRNFKKQSARNASDDILKAIQELKKHQIQGIILDLRNNGGGSLKDAVGVTGHFIKTGPVVQVKDRNTSHSLEDRDPTISYNGPLIVMVNTFSASASEILAGALQDYERAIIVGTTQTFGKGTVQTFYNLDAHPFYQSYKPLGSLKSTIQKFYRVNGKTTQYQGVIPDIILPSPNDYMEIGEKTLPHAMEATEINRLAYPKWSKKWHKGPLRDQSERRVKVSPKFTKINSYILTNKTEKDALQPLHFERAWAKQRAAIKESKSINDLSAATENATVTILIPTAESIKDDARKKELETWKTSLLKDIYLEETIAIMGDMITTSKSK
jgi:carboxyl-terminal processing protease